MISYSYSMVSSFIVDVIYQISNLHLVSVYGNRNTIVEFYFHIADISGIEFYELKYVFWRLQISVFYISSFYSSSPKVEIYTIFLCFVGNRNILLSGKFH